MTYQRNIWPLLDQEAVDEVLPDLVVRPEISADDEAGDEDDDCALDQLLLPRPLDLLQLGDGLPEEAERAPAGAFGRRARARAAAVAGAVGRDRGRARRCAAPGRGRLRAALAPLLAG